MHITTLMDGKSISCPKVQFLSVDGRGMPYHVMLSMNVFFRDNKNKVRFAVRVTFFLDTDGIHRWTSVFSMKVPLLAASLRAP